MASCSGKARVATLAALCAPLAGPPAASASTVVVVDSAGPEPSVIRYVAAPGERNRLTVDWHPFRDLVTLTDPGAVIAAPADVCTRTGEHSVDCHARPGPYGNPGNLWRLDAELGDLDDEVRFGDLGASSHSNLVDGGAGDDRLVGGRDGDELDGGTGDDELHGGFNDDDLAGGGGRDRLYGEQGIDTLDDGDSDTTADADVLDGGTDDDLVSYARRRSPVLVDLGDDGRDGARDEGDALRALEGVMGGAGADRLAGENRSRLAPYGPQGSLLDGGPGRDRLVGRRGDDQLVPGRGGAHVVCGRGDDTIREVTFRYGSRRPRAAPINRRTFLSGDCESLGPAAQTGPVTLAAAPDVERGAVSYEASCPLGGYGEAEPCAVRVRLVTAARPHALLGSGALGRGRWSGDDVHVRLTSRGRRLLARSRGVRATIRTAGRNFPRRSWTVRLRRTD